MDTEPSIEGRGLRRTVGSLGMSDFAKDMLNYYTSQSSSNILLGNLKNIHPSLTEDNYLSLAIMACNESISQEDRDIFKKCLQIKFKQIEEEGRKSKEDEQGTKFKRHCL